MLAAGTNVDWLREDLGLIATSAESHDVAATGRVGRRRRVRARPARPRHAAVGLRRTRHAARRHPGHDACPRRARRAGGRRPSRRRPRRRGRGRHRADDRAAPGRRRDEREPDVHPGAGRRRPAGPVEVSPVVEATTVGAAFLAGLATGVWGDIDDADRAWTPARVDEPDGTLDRATWARARRTGRPVGSPSCPRSTCDGLVELPGRAPGGEAVGTQIATTTGSCPDLVKGHHRVEKPTRRRLLAAGFSGTALGLLGSRAVSASPDTTTPTSDEGSTPQSRRRRRRRRCRRSARRTPTSRCLQFAESFELAARDLYQAALDAGAEEETLTAIRDNHQAYASVLKGQLGTQGAVSRNDEVYDEFEAELRDERHDRARHRGGRVRVDGRGHPHRAAPASSRASTAPT